MNKVEELINYFNTAYGIEKEWPREFEVSAELYGRCCQYIFTEYTKNLNDGLIRIIVGPHAGLMFKNVELIIRDAPDKSTTKR